MRKSKLNNRFYIFILLLFIIPATIIWPGLNGPLVYDDYPNLSPLLSEQPDYKRTVFDNEAGPLGRPVTMATFVVNHWLAGGINVKHLKLTNLFIHLVNTLLLFYLLLLLFSDRFSPARTVTLAFLVSLVWAVSPVNTGTVLYVIQRAALLSVTFMLLASITYVKTAEQYLLKNRMPVLMTSVCMLFWLIAMFCKENAVLLPLIILIIETCFFNRLPTERFINSKRLLAGSLVSLAVLFLLVFYISDLLGLLDYSNRIFTFQDRIYTEPIALVSYLKELLLPQVIDVALQRDDFYTSSSLWDLRTSASILFLIMLMICAVLSIRNRDTRYLGAGILIFFAGHLLESTIFPLRLYFEHRNYFPSIGVYMCVVLFSAHMFNSINIKNWLLVLLTVIYCLVLSQHSFRQSIVWSSRDLIVFNSYRNHPQSLEVNLSTAGYLVEKGDYENGLMINSDIINARPEVSFPAKIQRFYIYCERGDYIPENEYGILDRDLNLKNPLLISTALANFLESYTRRRCNFIDVNRFISPLTVWLDGLYREENYSAQEMWAVEYYLIEFLFLTGNEVEALSRLERQVELDNPRAKYFNEEVLPGRDL